MLKIRMNKEVMCCKRSGVQRLSAEPVNYGVFLCGLGLSRKGII